MVATIPSHLCLVCQLHPLPRPWPSLERGAHSMHIHQSNSEVNCIQYYIRRIEYGCYTVLWMNFYYGRLRKKLAILEKSVTTYLGLKRFDKARCLHCGEFHLVIIKLLEYIVSAPRKQRHHATNKILAIVSSLITCGTEWSTRAYIPKLTHLVQTFLPATWLPCGVLCFYPSVLLYLLQPVMSCCLVYTNVQVQGVPRSCNLLQGLQWNSWMHSKHLEHIQDAYWLLVAMYHSSHRKPVIETDLRHRCDRPPVHPSEMLHTKSTKNLFLPS